MANVPDRIQTWQMTEPGKLAKISIDMPEIQPGEVVVEIAGCGVYVLLGERGLPELWQTAEGSCHTKARRSLGSLREVCGH